ncbi:hypothetical protein RRG08_049323 [Elysia crispata]|uniref:Uncharacterized protein n=1 Tax=Elysia crispata TaxID=231223 RepID=A0AAE0XDT0_9GAST|nr:hypothetical protein RRG08_049323 [Elysia crispata]
MYDLTRSPQTSLSDCGNRFNQPDYRNFQSKLNDNSNPIMLQRRSRSCRVFVKFTENFLLEHREPTGNMRASLNHHRDNYCVASQRS